MRPRRCARQAARRVRPGHGVSEGMRRRVSATCARSISAITMPGPSPPSASTRPHGSTISEWPKHWAPPASVPHCAGRDHIGAVLDGARPLQHMPVRLARHLGEGGGCGQHLRARLGIGAVEMRKADVVADRKPDQCPPYRARSRRAPGCDGGGFAIAAALAQVDVEEVDLVIARGDRPLGSSMKLRLKIRPSGALRRSSR